MPHCRSGRFRVTGLVSTRIETPYHPARSLVTLPTALHILYTCTSRFLKEVYNIKIMTDYINVLFSVIWMFYGATVYRY